MKLNFDDSQGTPRPMPGGILFVDYHNKSFTLAIDGVYIAAVYAVNYPDADGEMAVGYDTVYFARRGKSYWVNKITTHDGLIFNYKE